METRRESATPRRRAARRQAFDPARLRGHPNVDLALAAWQAASRGDAQTLRSLCSPDLVWHTTGRGPLSGDHRGLDAALDHLAQVGDVSESFSSGIQDVLANDRRVALLVRVSGRRRDKRLETDYILLFEVAAGKIAEVWAVPRDQYAVDEFWRAGEERG